MQSKVSPEVQAIRKALGIDTWGSDIYRLKRRAGEMAQQEQFDIEFMEGVSEELDRLNEQVRELTVLVQTLSNAGSGNTHK